MLFRSVERADKTYLLMDEVSVHLITTCCNEIKECRSEMDFILRDFNSKLQVLDLGVKIHSNVM